MEIGTDVLVEIRDDIKEIRDKVVAHEVKLVSLCGNGRPGRVDILENNMDDLKQLKWKAIGFVIALVLLMEGAHVGIDKVIELFK